MQSYDGVDYRSAIDQHRNRIDVCNDRAGPRVIAVKRLTITLQVMVMKHWVGHEPG